MPPFLGNAFLESCLDILLCPFKHYQLELTILFILGIAFNLILLNTGIVGVDCRLFILKILIKEITYR